MIEQLPGWLDLLFIIIFFQTIFFFHFANGKPTILTLCLLVWSALHAVLAYSGFYENMDTIPPRFMLVIFPATIAIIIGLLPRQMACLEERRNLVISTFLHTIRVPVEITLYYLYVYEMVPLLMTFEGRNFDIVIGATAAIMGALLLFRQMNYKVLLFWNIAGLFFVLFILFNGILSTEMPVQLFGFDQPNRAVLYFPYVLLPATIVPIVVYTHISDILLLLKRKTV